MASTVRRHRRRGGPAGRRVCSVRVILSAGAVVLLVGLLTLMVVLRRGGGGEDLIGAHVTRPEPVTRPERTSAPAAVDDATWRRIGELAVAGRRMAAIELLRAATGCRLTEAKAVVDRLSA